MKQQGIYILNYDLKKCCNCSVQHIHIKDDTYT